MTVDLNDPVQRIAAAFAEADGHKPSMMEAVGALNRFAGYGEDEWTGYLERARTALSAMKVEGFYWAALVPAGDGLIFVAVERDDLNLATFAVPIDSQHTVDQAIAAAGNFFGYRDYLGPRPG